MYKINLSKFNYVYFSITASKSIDTQVGCNFMTEAFYFDDTHEFFRLNKKVIEENYFVFYAGIMAMSSPEVQNIYQLYNITDDNGSQAYCLWFSGNYIIHSFKWSNNILNALSQTVNFTELTKITFSGNKELLIALFRKNNIRYSQ